MEGGQLTPGLRPLVRRRQNPLGDSPMSSPVTAGECADSNTLSSELSFPEQSNSASHVRASKELGVMATPVPGISTAAVKL